MKLTFRPGPFDIERVLRVLGDQTPLTRAQHVELSQGITKLEAWVAAAPQNYQDFVDDPWRSFVTVVQPGPQLLQAIAPLRGGDHGGS